MTVSPFRTSLLFSIFISGSVFTIATLPLAMFRAQPVQVQVENQTVFDSELNAVSSPYLWLTGGFSAALGAGILAMGGWRLSASKLEKDKELTAEMEQKLQDSKAELERVSFSRGRLQSQGLNSFLEDETPQIPQTISAHQHPAAVVGVPNSSGSESNQISIIKTTDSTEKVTKDDHSMAAAAPLNGTATDTRSVLEFVMSGLHGRAYQSVMGTSEAAMPETNGSSSRPQHLSVVNSGNNTNERLPFTQQFQEAEAKHQLESVLHQLQHLAARVEDLQKGANNGVML